LFDGYGIYVWNNGSVYDGEFKQGVMQGEGDLDYSFGVTCSGFFSNNRFDESSCFDIT